MEVRYNANYIFCSFLAENTGEPDNGCEKLKLSCNHHMTCSVEPVQIKHTLFHNFFNGQQKREREAETDV